MTQIPPPRYRVVEKGRRLVVIDTVTGEAATREPPQTPTATAPISDVGGLVQRLPTGPQQTSFDGRATLVTHPIYDLKGPRTIDLDPSAIAFIGWLKIGASILAALFVAVVVFQPWLLALPFFVLLQPATRNGARTRITRWLDYHDSGASTG